MKVNEGGRMGGLKWEITEWRGRGATYCCCNSGERDTKGPYTTRVPPCLEGTEEHRKGTKAGYIEEKMEQGGELACQ